MENKNVKFIPLEWDTEFFGRKSAKIILSNQVSRFEEKKIKLFLEENNFITIVNENNNYINNQWLGSNTKAYLTDINIQFRKRLFKQSIDLNQSVSIKNKVEINPTIMRIAKESFSESRFFNDPMITDEKAAMLFNNWVSNSFNKEDKYFVVTQKNRLITGFILFSKDKESATIELIAVDENYRGEKIGRSMINHLEEYLIKDNILNLKVGTQVNNLKAINFYTKNGFRYDSNSSIYHLWKN